MKTTHKKQKTQHFQKKNYNPSWGFTHPPNSEFFSNLGFVLTLQNPLPPAFHALKLYLKLAQNVLRKSVLDNIIGNGDGGQISSLILYSM